MSGVGHDKKRSRTAVKAIEIANNKRTNDELYVFYKTLALANGYTGAGHLGDYEAFCYKNSLL